MTEKFFMPSFEEMNLSALYDLTFAVAVATGSQLGQQYLATTLRGPFNFDEMVGFVNEQWVKHQNNSRVICLTKELNDKFITLDYRTVEYIQERAADIIVERIFGTPADKQYTCEAGTTLTEVVKEA